MAITLGLSLKNHYLWGTTRNHREHPTLQALTTLLTKRAKGPGDEGPSIFSSVLSRAEVGAMCVGDKRYLRPGS